MDFEEPRKLLNEDLNAHNLFSSPAASPVFDEDVLPTIFKEELTTKKALELLIEGTLKSKVCRYCLCTSSCLSELDQILQIAGSGALYKVTIRDMVASFHPFKVLADPNFPNKICNKCLDRTISAYLFTQQCERSERALKNCFNDMYEKLDKLDPLDRTNKRGRQKKNPNYNILYTDHRRVIDYAEPIINIVHVKSVAMSKEPAMSELECPKCWQLFTTIEDMIIHEKTHPSSMWFNCRLCGQSFVKRMQLKRHLKQEHRGFKPKMTTDTTENTEFQCKTCCFTSTDYSTHLQHMEKHKFQMVLEHLVERDMDKLCAVCFDKQPGLVELDKMVRLHGGYPGAVGDKTLYSILGSTLPDMNSHHNYTGTRICERCLTNAITSYVFINHSIYTRDRLNICITSMIDSLNNLKEPEANLFIEIAKESILPIAEHTYFDENLLLEEDEIDETKLKVDVLEDEFRIAESEESESEPELKHYISNFLKEDDAGKSCVGDSDENYEHKLFNDNETNIFDENNAFDGNNVLGEHNEIKEFAVRRNYKHKEIDNPAKRVTKTYANRRLFNGFHGEYSSDNEDYSIDDVSEFLTFKKKKKPSKRYYKYKFRCPICSKSFVTDFHLQRHVLKHVNGKVECYICKFVFKSKFLLCEHIKMVHILDKSVYFACEICGRAFEEEEKLRLHERSHFAKECELCNKVFVTQAHYDNHMQRHAGKLKVTKLTNQICSFCEKDYSNDNKLSVHVNKVHLQIKPYSCDMCDRQYYNEKNLSKHKTIHSLKTKEKCQLCKMKFNTRKSMVIHLRKHTGETPHRCPVCGKAFYSETKAKNHMRKYHGGTLYCKLCKSVFTCKYELKTHVIMVHNHNALL